MHDLWVDLANSPHVLFFSPIVKRLTREGIGVFITARDFSETLDLARMNSLEFTTVGRHGGKSRLGKIKAFLERVSSLRKTLKDTGVKLLLTHNSYDAIVAAKLLGIPVWTYMDYDAQPANHLAFRLADRVHVPEAFPEDRLRRFGASPEKVFRYSGLKEEVYLRDFSPKEDYVKEVLGDFKRPLVVARPPSTSSLYSKGYGDFWKILGVFKSKGYDVRVITRNPADGEIAVSLEIPTVPKPVDTHQLLYWSDAFVGGGGTMTREAVILGTRVFTTLPKPGFLDSLLIQKGLVYPLSVEKALDVQVDTRTNRELRFFNPYLLDELVDEVLSFMRRHSCRT